MIRQAYRLHKAGVMGLNERNLRLVAELNPRRLMHLVDDKTVTKQLAIEAGIPTPELYGVIRNAYDKRHLTRYLSHPDGAVLKPAKGSQGNGILIISGQMKGGDYRLGNGQRISLEDVRYHTSNIRSGMYSLSGQPDITMIEALVQFDDVFSEISFRGVPDIRIIVLKGIPIAAMLRLPTAESDGKANLHKGGIGVGVNLITGTTTHGVQHGRMTDIHADTANPLAGLTVPHWEEMLVMASQAYDVTGLGYLGADIVIDKNRGPLLLELNARPGITIQVANRTGLRPHVNQVLALSDTVSTSTERIALAKTLFETAVVNANAA